MDTLDLMVLDEEQLFPLTSSLCAFTSSAASLPWLPRQAERPVQILSVNTHAIPLNDVAQPQAKVVPTTTARLFGLGTKVDRLHSCVCPFLMVGS